MRNETKALVVGAVTGIRISAAFRSAWPRQWRWAGWAEGLVDKLPFVPPRTQLPSLVGRIGSGAFAARRFARRPDERRRLALLGGLAALAGAYGGTTLRRKATATRRLPDLALGLVEDGVVSAGLRALRPRGAG